MAARSRTRLLLVLAVSLSLPWQWDTPSTEALALEAQYPALPPETTFRSLFALHGIHQPSFVHTLASMRRACGQSTAARAQRTDVRDKSKSTNFEITNLWARAFIGTRVLRAEGSPIGLLAKGTFSPGTPAILLRDLHRLLRRGSHVSFCTILSMTYIIKLLSAKVLA